MRVIIIVAAFVLASAIPVKADQIAFGSLVGVGSFGETVQASMGHDGFMFNGIAAPVGGVWNASNCMMPMCIAGSTVNLDAHFSGKDFPGAAIWNGTSYEQVGGPNSDAWIAATWAAALFIPSDFGDGVLSAPFTFTGTFGTALNGSMDLFGSGIVTASLSRRGDGSFHIGGISYDFDPEGMIPNPEPGTWLLLATGAAWLARRQHQRMR